MPGKVLDEDPYTRSSEQASNLSTSTNSINISFNNNSGGGFQLENANYTAGQPNRFTGNVQIYYTRDRSRDPSWTDNSAWTRNDILYARYSPHDSRQPAAGDHPKVGDIAVIGWVPWDDANRSTIHGQPHGIRLNSQITCAEVVFSQMLDNAGQPTSRFYRTNFQFRPCLCINTHDSWANGELITGLVKGEGMFWNRGSNPDYTKMDIGEFAKEDSSYVVYENFTNNRVYSNTPSLYPNLMLANDGWGSNNRNVSFNSDVNTTGNLELLG